MLPGYNVAQSCGWNSYSEAPRIFGKPLLPGHVEPGVLTEQQVLNFSRRAGFRFFLAWILAFLARGDRYYPGI